LEHRLRVLENRVLRKILGPKRDDVAGEWRKLYQEELHDLYCSPNIMRVIKSRRMRWGRGELHTQVWCVNLTKQDHLEYPGVDEWIILKWIFRKWDGGHGQD
jgi:hypothetical protein